jgi:protein arginine kinase
VTDPARLARTLPGWLRPADAGDDRIVLASRVRLARNVAGTRFRRTLARPEQTELVGRVLAACREALPWDDPLHVQVHRLGPANRGVLSERQLCSRELTDAKHPTGLHARDDGLVAIMGNEEDHVRLQSLAPGLDLTAALAAAVGADRRLAARLGWAVHPELGYLTACHTNVGTGMRASVMLHLPALAETGELKAVLHGAAKLGLAVRGRQGEGSEPGGHVYQLSNLRSLGHSEDQVCAEVAEAARAVVEAERLARTALLAARVRLEDKVFRAWGMLTGARILAGDEAYDLLGWLRVGRSLDLIPVPWEVLDRLWLQIQPHHLQALYKEAAETGPRDRIRARLVRDSLLPS